MLIKIEVNGTKVTRETNRTDVSHVMVARTASGKFEIVGLHKTEAKAKADCRNCPNPNFTERQVFAI